MIGVIAEARGDSLINDPDARRVQELEACWERIWEGIAGDELAAFPSLRERWEPLRERDPLVMDVDLLSPLGLTMKETAHTQIWSYLLDPQASHGFGRAPLNCFLDLLHRVVPSEEDPRAHTLRRLGTAWSTASIAPERRARILVGAEERDRRTDLWVELPSEAPELLLVIENKVNGLATPEQLSDYDQAIEQRLEQLGGHVQVVKVYLTKVGAAPPEQAGGADWLAVGYFDLALAWVRLLAGEEHEGTAFVRLYLASVLQRVLGIHLSSEQSHEGKSLLAEYFRARLGDAP